MTSGTSVGVQEVFANAMRHHQAGRLNEAERLYRQVLAVDSRHADSLHLLGVIAFQVGRHDLAVDLIGKAIAINPKVASYHSNLGNALRNQGRLDEAVACYRRAIDLKPNYQEAHYNLGNALQDQGRLDEAVVCYRRALDLKPASPEAHNNLGKVLQDQRRLDEAVACFRKAIDLKPDYPEAHSNRGNALRDLGRLDEAIACCRRAIDLKPDYPVAYNNLGNALEGQGRFEEATVAHETALRLGGDPGLSYYRLSNCRKFTEADRPLIADIQASLEDPKLSDASRSLLHFALGKIFDDLGEYETAIRHFDKANRLKRGEYEFDGSNFAAAVDWSIKTFPKDALKASVASDSELPVLIVGMPRSGTTLTEQILASHPKVAAAGELIFWLQRLDRMRNQFSRHDPAAERDAIRDYLALLTGIAPDAARVTDKMPYNFLVLGLVHRLFPKARIIHCRRNPIDTALSIYFTHFTGMHEVANSRNGIVFYYQRYRRLMEHWRAVLPPEQFIEIDYEELVADQERTSRRLVAFCGLDWDPACLDFHQTDRPINTASAWQARQPLYRTSAERWRRYEPWLGEFRELLE